LRNVPLRNFGAAERQELGAGFSSHRLRHREHEVGPRERGLHPAPEGGGAFRGHEFGMAQRDEVVLHHAQPRACGTGRIDRSPVILGPRRIGKKQHIARAEQEFGARRGVVAEPRR
jgi:hypothetical protein